jgi:hypothetical protein
VHGENQPVHAHLELAPVLLTHPDRPKEQSESLLHWLAGLAHDMSDPASVSMYWHQYALPVSDTYLPFTKWHCESSVHCLPVVEKHWPAYKAHVLELYPAIAEHFPPLRMH